jgi:cellulose synthase/poly-beta-1,6-N-acetylglucosamine synthase-like glycosyltransferase
MYFFLSKILHKTVIGYAPLYWMLITFIVFICCKILHEWIHYLFITVPPTPQPERIYTVDIFTTYCAGEPYEMIEETLNAIQAITYPHTTYLCDEADDPYLKELCKRIAVIHVTRKIKINAKAGNINNALNQSSGELCVVLDPDHVPFPEFLDPIVNHFNDPEIGFVQIVQAYSNIDDGLIAKGAAQQTYQFYGPIMMTMNKYGTVLAIGANCSFRRTALVSIGGHAAGLAEDMNTAMHLHAKGWKSVYVPDVLARGLVPNTLSAYYIQQLKWSRGVFELLVTSYPKLFRNFTWQQKLHYGFIPMYYLSGVIFLINFIVPVLSLTLDVIPFKIGMIDFVIIGFPLFMSIILIRHFVQKWVMEDEERGFHVVGGLLMIGTWWIFILGLFYTIIRKKVPYIPTPKDENEKISLSLYVPNIILILVSIASIIYGLITDWNPYTIIMSSFAGLNCLILFFTIYAGMQNKIRTSWDHKNAFGLFLNNVLYYKGLFWKMRRRVIYAGLRNMAVLIMIFATCLILYFVKTRNIFQEDTAKPKKYHKDMLLSGIFAPLQPDGLSTVQSIQQLEQKNKIHFNIISLYIPWGDQQQCCLPFQLLDSVYLNNSIPMITWEPWQKLFADIKNNHINDKERKVFLRISKGEFDKYIDRFSQQIKSLNHPVFLRFAHEADNPQYPWSQSGGNTSDEFKDAWKYVHEYFIKNKVWNAIWVWNPWKANAIDSYFPGRDYVDWLAVTSLNYSFINPGKKDYSMAELYAPFHNNSIYTSGLPVMLAEMGSLKPGAEQQKWFTDAFGEIKTRFPEINAFVLFNTSIDKNTPDPNIASILDWHISNMNLLSGFVNKNNKLAINSFSELSKDSIFAGRPTKTLPKEFTAIKGINYTKGQNWLIDYHALTKKELINDFKEIKQTGFNTIKWYGPGIYDRNILSIADQEQLKVNYSFWIPDDFKFISNKDAFTAFAKKVIRTIKELKSNKNIISWNIGNTVAKKLELYYAKPELFSQQETYIRWLKKLIVEIKTSDPIHPVTVDVDADKSLIPIITVLQNNIPEIDAYGLVMTEKSAEQDQIEKLKMPYFFSKISSTKYLTISNKKTAVFISNWQDRETKNYVTFDGLKDKFGRNKLELTQLRNTLKGISSPIDFPQIKILLPAVTILPGISLQYHAIIYKNGSWKLANEQDGLIFKWELVKNDIYSNPVSMKLLGEGPVISFELNEDPLNYSICLYISNGKEVKIVQSKLNTPLY